MQTDRVPEIRRKNECKGNPVIADPAPNLYSVSKFGSVRYDLYNGSSNLGETCAFCHAAMRNQVFRTGIYNSPYVI